MLHIYMTVYNINFTNMATNLICVLWKHGKELWVLQRRYISWLTERMVNYEERISVKNYFVKIQQNKRWNQVCVRQVGNIWTGHINTADWRISQAKELLLRRLPVGQWAITSAVTTRLDSEVRRQDFDCGLKLSWRLIVQSADLMKPQLNPAHTHTHTH
jgi:hypothetical protein